MGLDFAKIAKKFKDYKSLHEITKSLYSSNLVRIYPLSKTVSYSQNKRFKMRFGADIKLMKDYENNRILLGVSGNIWSKAVDENYTWKPLNSYYNISDLGKIITITAMGFFEIKVTSTASGGVNVSGFLESTSDSTTYYLRSDNLRGNASYTAW